MSDREDTNDGRELDECDRVRKAPSGGTANTKFRAPRAGQSGKRPGLRAIPPRAPRRPLPRGTFHGQDLRAAARTTQRQRPAALLRLRLNPDGLHGRRSFASISARATDQSSPPSESASTRLARRSISTIQARLRASASFGPSRLATRARAQPPACSSSVRSKTSRRAVLGRVRS